MNCRVLGQWCRKARMVRCSPGGVESVGEALFQVREEVSVPVVGDLDRGVSEPLGDGEGVPALGDQEGRKRVADVVDTETLGQPGLFDSRDEVTCAEVS